MYKKTGGGLLFLAILVAGCLYILTDAFTENPTDAKGKSISQGFLNPGIFQLVLGIDLDGGAELTYGQLDFSLHGSLSGFNDTARDGFPGRDARTAAVGGNWHGSRSGLTHRNLEIIEND